MLPPVIQSLKNSSVYFIAWVVFCLGALIYLPYYSTAECFIRLNVFHTEWMDRVFPVITFLGDGMFLLAVALMLAMARRYGLALKMVLAFIASGLLVQVLKNTITAPRPKVLLQSLELPYQYFIDGITRIGNSSFPSGHTATFFALATLLAMQTKNRYWQLFFLLVALLVGYSRIYLGQHFLQDVLMGSFIGICTAIPVQCFMPKKILFRKQSNQSPPYAVQ
jgi:membrane-associated phospholipid phosphatase